MTVNTRRLVAVVLATALLAACGGSQEPKSVVTGELGPISQRLADLTDRFDDDVNAALATMVEEAIAACMKEQGFDYTPRGWNASDVAQLTDMPDPASAEYAELYGYGITTTDDAPRTLTLPGTDDPQMTDPAYVEALQGKPDDGPVWKPGGCYGQIIDQFDTYRLLTSTVLRDIARFSSQVEADDRVLAALDGWATCMAGKGYEHATPDEARESITARTRVDGKPITGADLQALRAEEIATAVDDHACSTDLEQTRAAVLAELETAYYEENTTEVDAFFTQFEQFLARGHD